jgi:hypothetical protein
MTRESSIWLNLTARRAAPPPVSRSGDSPAHSQKIFSEVLNLRIDEAMSREVKRIAKQGDQPESETARALIAWGIEAHRAREVALLELPYDMGNDPVDRHGEPLVLRVVARWEPWAPWDAEGPVT